MLNEFLDELNSIEDAKFENLENEALNDPYSQTLSKSERGEAIRIARKLISMIKDECEYTEDELFDLVDPDKEIEEEYLNHALNYLLDKNLIKRCEESGKYCKNDLHESLTEKMWEKEVPADVALKFRQGVNSDSETIADAVEGTQALIDWLVSEFPDIDYELESIRDSLSLIDPFDYRKADFGEYDEEDEFTQTVEDYFNTEVLDPLYDLCDQLNIWIPTEGMLGESAEGDATAQEYIDSKNDNFEKDKETTREVRKELAAQGIATKEDGTPITEENKENLNKLVLDEDMNNNILAHQQKLREPEDKAVEVQDPAFAKASEDIEKANEKKAEFVKIEKAPEHKEEGETPKMADGAKKLYLDESLFTDFDEPELLRSLRVDVYADNIIEVSEDNASGSTYKGSTAADVAFAVQSYLEDNELND